jgi:hypothetical protein
MKEIGFILSVFFGKKEKQQKNALHHAKENKNRKKINPVIQGMGG